MKKLSDMSDSILILTTPTNKYFCKNQLARSFKNLNVSTLLKKTPLELLCTSKKSSGVLFFSI